MYSPNIGFCCQSKQETVKVFVAYLKIQFTGRFMIHPRSVEDIFILSLLAPTKQQHEISVQDVRVVTVPLYKQKWDE